MVSVKSALQFLSTVRHLRSRQVTGQIRDSLRPLFEKPERLRSQAAPEFGGCRWCLKLDFLPPGPQNNRASGILNGRFSFLNNKQSLGWPPHWNCNNLPKLWQYNLHYFEYLWALDYSKAKTLASAWIANHPLGRGQVGWEPYPTSLRLINFCGVFFCKYRRHTEADADFLRSLWGSIYLQTEWLSKRLETHILGNHLFENIAALTIAGSCFSGTAADKWFQTGIRILAEQIHEQILDDGTHFERSPMYHCRIVYLLCLLLNIANDTLRQLIAEPLEKAVRSLQHLTHPDGDIALLNDSAFDIYNKPEQLVSYSNKLLDREHNVTNSAVPEQFALPEAGYYGQRTEDGSYLICDAGPLGPDYIPGHAHADMFSFELSLKGHRVIVDSGVYNYEIDRMRQYCRSTTAHNTLEINGEDQCQMWAAFRVGRRGRPHNVKWLPSDGGFQLSAWHDGYYRLKGGPIHHRQFNWNKSGSLIVKDKIIASRPQSLVSRLHLHPDCIIDELKDNSARIIYPAGKFKISFSNNNGELSVEDSFYCPEFGIKKANTLLAFSFSGSQVQTEFRIEVL